MDKKTIAKSMLIWLCIIPLAFINGALRESLLEPMMGAIAQPISGVLLMLCIFAVSFFLIPRLGSANKATYIGMGITWVVATLVFETLLGVAMGTPFTEIIAAYNILTGNIWLIVVVFIGLAPYIAAKLRKLI
jgi:hypothetical protein